MDAAAPNKPCAKARSFCGNHSALLFVVPGHGPASPNPSIIRKKVSEKIPRERDANASAAPPDEHAPEETFPASNLVVQFPGDKLADTVCYHKEDSYQTKNIFRFLRSIRVVAVYQAEVDSDTFAIGYERNAVLLLHLYVGYADRIPVAISGCQDILLSCQDGMITFICRRIRFGNQVIVDISHPHIVERTSIQIVDDGYQHN